MSAITIIAVACSILAAAVFLAGYVHGFSKSIAEHNSAQSTARPAEDKPFFVPIFAAVVSSGVVIALLGVTPLAISLAPFLSILSAAVIGSLFFIESKLDA